MIDTYFFAVSVIDLPHIKGTWYGFMRPNWKIRSYDLSSYAALNQRTDNNDWLASM